MDINERNRLAAYHITKGGECARCDLTAIKVIDGLAYCSDDCERRISDYGLESAEARQHGVYTFETVSILSLELLVKEFRDIAVLHTEYACQGLGFKELIERADTLLGSAKG